MQNHRNVHYNAGSLKSCRLYVPSQRNNKQRKCKIINIAEDTQRGRAMAGARKDVRMAGREFRKKRQKKRDGLYVYETVHGYTAHITDCQCTLAGFYKALKILFVIKFPSRTPLPLPSRRAASLPGCALCKILYSRGSNIRVAPFNQCKVAQQFTHLRYN